MISCFFCFFFFFFFFLFYPSFFRWNRNGRGIYEWGGYYLRPGGKSTKGDQWSRFRWADMMTWHDSDWEYIGLRIVQILSGVIYKYFWAPMFDHWYFPCPSFVCVLTSLTCHYLISRDSYTGLHIITHICRDKPRLLLRFLAIQLPASTVQTVE